MSTALEAEADSFLLQHSNGGGPGYALLMRGIISAYMAVNIARTLLFRPPNGIV